MTHPTLSTFIYLITLTAIWLNDVLNTLNIYLFNTLTAIWLNDALNTLNIYLFNTLTAIWLNDALETLDIYLFNNTHSCLIEWRTQHLFI